MISKAREAKLLAFIVGLLVIIGIGMSGLHYIRDSYNPGFEKYSTITFIHIVPGAIYLGLAPFQFIALIRRRWLNVHRIIGRTISALAIMVGITAFFMAIVFPFSGMLESISVGIFATVFLYSIVQGLLKIRAGNIAHHREWMLRAFALGLAIATSRIIFLPFFFALVNPTLEQVEVLFITSFILAFSFHLILAEIWIRRTREQKHNNYHHRQAD
ncbi:MAG: DUF2306 domain-containing protein [Bacteroidota bacterium]